MRPVADLTSTASHPGTRHCVECLKHSKTAKWTDPAGVATAYGFVIVPPPFRAKVVIRTTVAGDLT